MARLSPRSFRQPTSPFFVESEVGQLAGRIGLLLGIRPSELLGLKCSELKRFVIDAALLAKALEAVAPEGASSTKELIRRKRSKWLPPRRWPERWP